MLTVTRFAESALTYYMTSGFSFGLSTYPSRSVYHPNIALGVPPSIGHDGVETVTIKNGVLVPGTKVVGDLRDKGVRHTQLEGSVVISECLGRGAAIPDTSSVLNSGYSVQIGGTTQQVSAVIPWGADTDVPVVRPITEGYNSSTRTKYLSHLYKGRHVIRFVNDYCLIMSYVDYDQTIEKWSSLGTLISSTPYRRRYNVAQWFQIKYSGTTPQLYRSTAYTAANVTGGWGFTLPSGIQLVDKVGPDPRSYGVVCNTLVSTKYLLTATEQEGMSRQLFDHVVERLSAPAMLEYGIKALAFYEVSEAESLSEFGEMTKDIIRQQKYVDADLIASGFEFLELRKLIGSSAKILGELKELLLIPLVRHPSYMYEDLFSKFTSMRDKTRVRKVFKKEIDQVTREVKTLASGSLFAKFGVAPTVRDVADCMTGLVKFFSNHAENRRYHTRRTSDRIGLLDAVITTEKVLTAEVKQWPRTYHDGDFWDVTSGEIQAMMKWGLYPKPSTLWDITPFTWLSDTLLDIGSALDDVNAHYEAQYFPVSHCVLSSKQVWSPSPSRLFRNNAAITGSINFIDYSRWIEDDLPLPKVWIEEAEGPAKYWAEAGAIVVQRLKL